MATKLSESLPISPNKRSFTAIYEDEKGLCINLLQECAQRMNYTNPIYNCEKDEALDQLTPFKCTVEIGGIRYDGGAARTKKEAKIQAARSALVAMRSNKAKISSVVENNSLLTILPFRKRAAEPQNYTEEASESTQVNKRLRKLESSRQKLDHDRVDDAGCSSGNPQVGDLIAQTAIRDSPGLGVSLMSGADTLSPISMKNSNSTLYQIESSTCINELNQHTEGIQAGVLNPYVFKSRLLEYTQKVGLPVPAYRTLREGPSHEPSFRSSVTVNNIRYESLPGFFNRKASEQSAAEVALLELAKSGALEECNSKTVRETGLCKSLLQEYAQKLNHTLPLYQCKKDERPDQVNCYTCTVEVGGIYYIGDSARTKKEAEIKAARTALLAIQSVNSNLSGEPDSNSPLAELCSKKRVAEPVNHSKEITKKARFEVGTSELYGCDIDHDQVNNVSSDEDHPTEPARDQTGTSDPKTPDITLSSMPHGNTLAVTKEEVSKVTRVSEVTSLKNDSSLGSVEAVCTTDLNQSAEATNAGVSNGSVFKSRLMEYAQKSKLPLPVYETSREGPSQEPYFVSSVTVNGIQYKSLHMLHSRKASEQSAAEVALLELGKSGELGQSISQPVNETGLCKNMLQEYGHKLSYPIPLYQCQRDEGSDQANRFRCTVEIGGVQYMGDAARTIKEAEIKPARKALLAIQSMNAEVSNEPVYETPKKTSFGNEISNPNSPEHKVDHTVLDGAESVSNQAMTPDVEQCSNGASIKIEY